MSLVTPEEKKQTTDDGQTAHFYQSETQRSTENKPNNTLNAPFSPTKKRKSTDDEKITVQNGM